MSYISTQPGSGGGGGGSFGVVTAWTPVLKFGGSATGITYTTQVGQYVQNGNVINFSLNIVLSSKGAQAGAATITGLPSTIGANAVYPVASGNLTFIMGADYIAGQIASGSSPITINLLWVSSGTTTTASTNTDFSDTTSLQISGSYLI
jgi:hypothetical protein